MDGEFEIYTDDQNGSRTLLWSSNMSIAANAQSNDITNFTQPDKDIIIVFHGRLGEEENAVIGKVSCLCNSVTDIDGNTYAAVKIGNQCWTAENLKTTRYNDGAPIAYIPDQMEWYNLYLTGSTTGAYCFYDNNAANGAKYGALYNWYAVGTGKLAPDGWHVPTDAEWDTLQNYLIANGYNYDGTTTGNKIAKSLAAQTDWYTIQNSDLQYYPGAIVNNLSANNSCGFAALPGGCRDGDDGGFFYNQSWLSIWWSATEDDASGAYVRYLNYNDSDLGRSYGNESYGFSVRLVRDMN
jgi:uncharacterized protein (TIGR02145 family)